VVKPVAGLLIVSTSVPIPVLKKIIHLLFCRAGDVVVTNIVCCCFLL